MSNDTVLIIMGTHGMKINGGNGEKNQFSKETLIFGYRKDGFKTFKNRYDNLFVKQKSNVNEVKLVDITSTISILLGLPIPFSNVGTFIPDFLVQK